MPPTSRGTTWHTWATVMASTPWGGGRERTGWDLHPKGLLRALCRPFLEALENYYAVCRQTLNIRGTCPESLSWCENQATDPHSDFKDSGIVEIPFPREVDIAQATWQPGAEAEPIRVFSLLTLWCHASPTGGQAPVCGSQSQEVPGFRSLMGK